METEFKRLKKICEGHKVPLRLRRWKAGTIQEDFNNLAKDLIDSNGNERDLLEAIDICVVGPWNL
jgi:hypothetical protein